MARITSIKPPCGYVSSGVNTIQLLDFEDFTAYQFEGLYDTGMVVDIIKTAGFIDLQTADGAKYSSTLNGKIYVHTLQTFISELSADTLRNLNLALRRKYVAVFRLNNGKYYTFGYEAGATLTYTNQSDDGIGSVVTIQAASIYPLFETVYGATLGAWILRTGFWDTEGVWKNNGVWKY